MSSWKCWPFCLSLTVLKNLHIITIHIFFIQNVISAMNQDVKSLVPKDIWRYFAVTIAPAAVLPQVF